MRLFASISIVLVAVASGGPILAAAPAMPTAPAKPATSAPAAVATSQVAQPLAVLQKLLRDPKTASDVLSALRAADDKDLLPLFRAAAAGSDESSRVFAVATLAKLGGKDVADTLAGRLAVDSSDAVKVEALIGLAMSKSCTADQLLLVTKSANENLRCVAARTLVQIGQGQAAAETLEKLTSSPDRPTAAMARMSLLGLGRAGQMEPLRKMMLDSSTTRGLPEMLLEQIGEEKIAAALELAQELAKPQQPWQLRLRAYRAISAIAKDAASQIREAIVSSDMTAFRVHMLKLLALRDDAAAELATIAKGDDAVAALAKLEIARRPGGSGAAAAVEEALRAGHPVVVDYVLGCAAQDVQDKGDKAVFYIDGLVSVIQTVQNEPSQLAQEHVRGARAATILADMKAPAANEALKKILAGSYGPVVRVTATGLLRAKNPDACDLVRPLLTSPYDELATDAALILGHFGDADARDSLQQIIQQQDRHSTLLVSLAGWYLLKISRQTQPAAAELAKEIR